MATKTYISRFRDYKVKAVKEVMDNRGEVSPAKIAEFNNGRYVTDDEEIQKGMEAAGGYRCDFFLAKDGAALEPKVKVVEGHIGHSTAQPLAPVDNTPKRLSESVTDDDTN